MAHIVIALLILMAGGSIISVLSDTLIPMIVGLVFQGAGLPVAAVIAQNFDYHYLFWLATGLTIIALAGTTSSRQSASPSDPSEFCSASRKAASGAEPARQRSGYSSAVSWYRWPGASSSFALPVLPEAPTTTDMVVFVPRQRREYGNTVSMPVTLAER